MSLKCECGGTFRRVKLERYDFTGFAGLPVELRDAPLLVCDKGGEIVVEGELIDAALLLLTQMVLGLERGLTADESKFLRKRLQLSRVDLAEKMVITPEMVAAWESGQQPLSPQNDYILRGLHIGAHRPEGVKVYSQETWERALGKVHAREESPTPPKPFIIAGELDRLRGAAVHL